MSINAIFIVREETYRDLLCSVEGPDTETLLFTVIIIWSTKHVLHHGLELGEFSISFLNGGRTTERPCSFLQELSTSHLHNLWGLALTAFSWEFAGRVSYPCKWTRRKLNPRPSSLRVTLKLLTHWVKKATSSVLPTGMSSDDRPHELFHQIRAHWTKHGQTFSCQSWWGKNCNSHMTQRANPAVYFTFPLQIHSKVPTKLSDNLNAIFFVLPEVE